MSARVVQLQRKPHPGQISHEIVFDAVRAALGGYDVEVVVDTHANTGLLPRLAAVVAARRHQGDVTHVVGDVHYLVLLLRKRSTVLTIQDVEFLDRHTGLRAALYRWLWVELPIRRSRVVTVASEATRQDLARVVRARLDHVRVIPNPVRAMFTPSPLPCHERQVVLLVGTWPNKNLERSLQALTGMPVDVVVLGPLNPEQRRLVDGLGADSRTGLTDAQVVATVSGCDVLLFPSLKEGFGLPILEAQASGRPVVTSDRPPMRDVAGDGACLVDPEDVASIRAGVERVLADRGYAESLVAAGLRNVEGFRVEAVAAGYAAVYDEVLSTS